MVYLFVGIGGMIGSLFRYLLSNLAVSYRGIEFPFGTLFINLTGAVLLGWMSNRLTNFKKVHPKLFTGFTTGIIGSYTTFSTLTVDAVKLLESGALLKSFLYISISLFGGLMFVRVGSKLGEKGGKR